MKAVGWLYRLIVSKDAIVFRTSRWPPAFGMQKVPEAWKKKDRSFWHGTEAGNKRIALKTKPTVYQDSHMGGSNDDIAIVAVNEVGLVLDDDLQDLVACSR